MDKVTYTLVLVKHDGNEEREASIDRATRDQLVSFFRRIQKTFPELSLEPTEI
jgi:hypothetical protein